MTAPVEPTPLAYAACPSDRTPLVATFEVSKKEWHCMTCGRYLEFFGVVDVPKTDETEAQYLALQARFLAGERGPVS